MLTLSAPIQDWNDFGSYLGVSRHIASRGQRQPPQRRAGYPALATGDREGLITSFTRVRSMLGVLGLDPRDGQWRSRDPDDRLQHTVDALIRLLVSQREVARARDDYASADSIRDTLEKVGVVVEDTPKGPRWELKR